MYKRVLLKLSGEQLSGKFDVGIDPEIAAYFAQEVKEVITSGCELIIVVGGGNMVRGAEVAGHGVRRVTADHMGMLSGLINAMALTDIFESQDVPTRCLSNIFSEQVVESYSYRLAEKHLERGRVIIVAGGMGRPYFTHDTAAVNIALELDCQAVLKATKVDGVYDKDPNKFSDALKLEGLKYHDAVADCAIKVMDKAAMGLALEQHMPLVVFDAMKPGSILAACQEKPVGTRIS